MGSNQSSQIKDQNPFEKNENDQKIKNIYNEAEFKKLEDFAQEESDNNKKKSQISQISQISQNYQNSQISHISNQQQKQKSSKISTSNISQFNLSNGGNQKIKSQIQGEQQNFSSFGNEIQGNQIQNLNDQNQNLGDLNEVQQQIQNQNLRFINNSNLSENLGFGGDNEVNFSGNFNNGEFQDKTGYNDSAYLKSVQDQENGYDAEFLNSNGSNTYQISEQSMNSLAYKSRNTVNNQNFGSQSNPQIDFSSFKYSSQNLPNLKRIQEQSGNYEQDQVEYDDQNIDSNQKQYDEQNYGQNNFYGTNIAYNINIENEKFQQAQGNIQSQNYNHNYRNSQGSGFFLQFDNKQNSQLQNQQQEINGSFLLSSNKNSQIQDKDKDKIMQQMGNLSEIAMQVGNNLQYINNGVQFVTNNNNNNNNVNNSFMINENNSCFSLAGGRESQKKGSNLLMNNNQFQDVLSKMSAMSIENNKSGDISFSQAQKNRLGMSFEFANKKVDLSKFGSIGVSKEDVDSSLKQFLKNNSIQSSNRSQYQKKIGYLFKVEEEEKHSKNSLSQSQTSEKFQKFLANQNKQQQYEKYYQSQPGLVQQSGPSQFSSHASKNLSQQIQFDEFSTGKDASINQVIKMSQETKGCQCTKSYCLKQYCICFQKKMLCNPQFCKCTGCKNVEGNEERNSEIEKKLKQNPRAFDNKFQVVDIKEINGKFNNEKLFQQNSKNNIDFFKLATPEMYQQLMQQLQKEEDERKNKSASTQKKRIFSDDEKTFTELKIENQESNMSQLMIPGKEIFCFKNEESQSNLDNQQQNLQDSNFYSQRSRYEDSENLSQNQTKLQAIQQYKQSKKTVVYKQGCTCKKSHCIKKYCECYNKQIKCTPNCSCKNCHNMEEYVPDAEEIEQKQKLKQQEMDLIKINQKRQLDLQQRQSQMPVKKRQLIGADLDEDY